LAPFFAAEAFTSGLVILRQIHGPGFGVSHLYNHGMNEASFTELAAWLTQAGLAGTSETEIVSGF
jgi:hypothetical protein